MAARPQLLQLEDVRRAWDARDPDVVRLIADLSLQPDVPPDPPPREGAMTFARLMAEVRAKPFRKKPNAEQAHYRVEQLKAVESATAELPLPGRLRLHEIVLAMWAECASPAGGTVARQHLLTLIATVPLRYGPWRALKRIFKEAEANGDTAVWGALAARFDATFAGGHVGRLVPEVGKQTLGYLSRRAWRHLRRLGQTLPAVYADVACDVLAAYRDDEVNWNGTWVANHILYHETGKYGRGEFHFGYGSRPTSLTKDRAFAEAWQRTPRPLFSLLERAKSDKVREFAAACLKADFRAALRDVEPAWVSRLAAVGSGAVDAFVVWVLTNVPRFEQAAFRDLGLHETVLRLFDSKSDEAAAYAAGYARTHARDLPVARLVTLANSDHEPVRKLAADLLTARDARTEVGLDAWGKLLGTDHAHDLAAAAIRKHFGAKELTPEWFADRLFAEGDEAFDFAAELLPQVHPPAKLGAAFFAGLVDRIDDADAWEAERVAEFALDHLAKLDVAALDPDFLKRAFVHPLAKGRVREWVDAGKLKVQALPPALFKALAYHPLWEADPWVSALRAGGKKWAKAMGFDESMSAAVLGWMRDVRRFASADLGFDWLMQLVARSEPRYHDFAVEVMTKAFVPADFAPTSSTQAPAGTSSELSQPRAEARASAAASPAIDFKGASFVFTGKLATMTRKDAEGKVSAANGTNFDAVSAKLAYLVIGDEGSPLYGAGKKGSKQVKAEQVNAGGGNIKIISETAFLKMLAGQQQEASGDATAAGLERLWQMATAAGGADAQVAAFARRYIRKHHPDIALAETERPVDPGAEVPPAFLSFDRVKPLLADSRKPVREFALELAKWEFARWAPAAGEIVRLSELPFEDVRKFVATALLADDAPEHKRYRIDPAVMTPAAAYGFVESADDATRELGMELIRRQPRLRLPQELFRLTESPDRKVRAFVIGALRALYRDRGITEGWKPTLPPQPTIGATARKTAAAAERRVGDGPPARPDHLPADAADLRQFLRRTLFELPPGRLPPRKTDGQSEAEAAAATAGVTAGAAAKTRGRRGSAAGASGGTGDGQPAARARLKTLPARKAKLALVETLRDVAVADAGFAAVVLPLLEEFLAVRGQSEHAATLVAVTRVRAAHAASADG
jgi:hypothetical protein